MHDPEAVYEELALRRGDVFLDLGCGPGDYALRASGIVGAEGRVYALDTKQHLIEGLRDRTEAMGIENLVAMVSDLTGTLPLEDRSVDVCLLSTVLHIYELADIEDRLFGGMMRALKPGGRLAVIECKKEAQPFGPPRHMRLSPDEIERSVTKFGFESFSFLDLGYNYMVLFRLCSAGSMGPQSE